LVGGKVAAAAAAAKRDVGTIERNKHAEGWCARVAQGGKRVIERWSKQARLKAG
jgi:hypothetical protein